jgi:hydroxymethylbilane synthase
MLQPTYIATRKSPLALIQTQSVRTHLQAKFPEEQFEELRLSTKVDERLNWSLEKRGGIGLFTKELEEALLDERASLAVHSAKDLPTQFQADLCIAGYLPRARANDVLVQRNECPMLETIATGSPRRRAQVSLFEKQARWTVIRGNVETRLRKIADGEADATLLAAAGLERLGITGFEGLKFTELPIDQVVPAPGQAAIAIQCRIVDLPRYEHLFCETTKRAVSLERAFLSRLGSGCQIPVGAYYSEGIFHVFYPKTGYASFEVEINSVNEIDTILDGVFKNLKL